MVKNIRFLLARRYFLKRRLSELIYGSIEIRKNHLYVHYREAGHHRIRLVGDYSDALHNLILSNNAAARSIKRSLRAIDRSLNSLGYVEAAPAPALTRVCDYISLHQATIVHDYAALSGVHAPEGSVARVLSGASVSHLTARDAHKITNLQNALAFISDPAIAALRPSLDTLCEINYLLEEGFFFGAGDLRDVPLTLGSPDSVPLPPAEPALMKSIASIVNNSTTARDQALDLALLIIEIRPFLSSNTLSALYFANHLLIHTGQGLLVVPAPEAKHLKSLVDDFRATGDRSRLRDFLGSKIHMLPPVK